MTSGYSLHSIALKAAASGPGFERFFHEEIESVPAPAGLTVRLLRRERGERTGRHLLMFELESVERPDQLFPETGPAGWQMSAEVTQWMGARPGLVGRARDPY